MSKGLIQQLRIVTVSADNQERITYMADMRLAMSQIRHSLSGATAWAIRVNEWRGVMRKHEKTSNLKSEK